VIEDHVEQSITVYYPDDENPPFEFGIKSSFSLEEIIETISDMMGLQVRTLRNKGNLARIIQRRDLCLVTDVIVCLEDDLELLKPKVAAGSCELPYIYIYQIY
jgi:hypothetical protein